MPHMPNLRVVPLESIRRHEEIDPLRVERLSGRIDAEGIQVNPMVCVQAPSGEYVLLDGATRTESLKRIGLVHAVIQVVEPDAVTLGTWHHVVRGCAPEEVMAAVSSDPSLELSEGPGKPSLQVRGAAPRLVQGTGISSNATLSRLVAGYVGRWTVTRTIDPDIGLIESSFSDWAALVEFPTLSIEYVMKAAVGEDLLPAGITRFKVPDRALRLNIPLEILRRDASAEDKQAALDQLLDERSHDGRVRHYEEPVFILDD